MGTNGRQYSLALAPRRTLVASFDIVGDSVQTKQQCFPEAKQVALVEQLVGSIVQLTFKP
jgi:hypothetical protein